MFYSYRIEFEYADAYSNWKTRRQECLLVARSAQEAVKKCVELYGLGYDCDYKIKKVEKVED